MTPYRSSASQVSTFELCPRKWAFLKIEKLEDPPSRFAKFGTKTHAHLEDWFLHRRLPPQTKEGRAARAILRHLPPPQTPGIDVEHEIGIVVGGVRFKGFIDVRILNRDPRPLVSDHKTTGDLKWAKSPDDLPNDVQATLYALDTMNAAGCDAVDLQWTYATRDRARSLPVLRTVTRAEIEPRIAKTAQAAGAMKQLFETQTPALSIEPNAAGCEAFGGCPFRNRCNLSPQERMRSIMSQEEHSNFLNRLREQKSNGASAPPAVNPPEAEAAPTPEPEPEPEPKTKPKRKPRAKKAAPEPKPNMVELEVVLDAYRRGFKDGCDFGRENA